MSKFPITVSTPSRICLFGEHQDYLGLQVIALAINLRFSATLVPRADSKIVIHSDYFKDDDATVTVPLDQPIHYQNKRDYLRSTIKVLQNKGLCFPSGADVYLKSQIPIGKGMCSSTALVMVLIKLYLEYIGAPQKDQPETMAQWGFEAEVETFGEPGGKMDHVTSAMGGLLHLDFVGGGMKATRLSRDLPGRLLLFDSLEPKDTIGVLAGAKTPVQEGLATLAPLGVESIRDLAENDEKLALLSHVLPEQRHKILASVDNYRIQRKALKLLSEGPFDPVELGNLLKRHHANLRDGLGISTPTIERIFAAAYDAGALGGKINGSGGGGCGYVYVRQEDAKRVTAAIERLGYPVYPLTQDTGIKREAYE